MVDEDSELITLFYGNGLREEEAMALKEIIEESFPEQSGNALGRTASL